MRYMLIAFCERCGKSTTFEGDTDITGQNGYIGQTIITHTDFTPKGDHKKECPECAEDYEEFIQKRKDQSYAF